MVIQDDIFLWQRKIDKTLYVAVYRTYVITVFDNLTVLFHCDSMI